MAFDLARVHRAILDGEHDPAKLWHLGDQPNREIHTIPVPDGWSIEQAWEAVSRGEDLTDLEPAWAAVEVKDGRMIRVLPTTKEESDVHG